MSISEYYQMYLIDVEIDLDNEHVYPYTPRPVSVLEFNE
jgi:hypothetical protein